MRTYWNALMPRWREPGTPAPAGLKEWVARAACTVEGGDWFAEADTDTADTMAVERAMCARCPVRQDCLAYALDAGEPFGLWGGFTTVERRSLIGHLAASAGPVGVSNLRRAA